MSLKSDEKFMARALELARMGAQTGEVPVAALIVQGGEIIAESHNLKETNQDPLGHAELRAISQAAKALKSWRLCDSDLYVTLEPCLMCAGAIIQARLKRVIIGARDPKAGAVESLYQSLSDPRLNHSPQVTFGVLEEDCSRLLTEFFRQRRKEKKGPR